MDGVVLLVLIFCEYPLVIVLVEELSISNISIIEINKELTRSQAVAKIADRTAHSRLCNNN